MTVALLQLILLILLYVAAVALVLLFLRLQFASNRCYLPVDPLWCRAVNLSKQSIYDSVVLRLNQCFFDRSASKFDTIQR